MTQRNRKSVHTEEISIRTLARLAEVRDPETGNHILRTQGYVRTTAEQMRGDPITQGAEILALAKEIARGRSSTRSTAPAGHA